MVKIQEGRQSAGLGRVCDGPEIRRSTGGYGWAMLVNYTVIHLGRQVGECLGRWVGG